MILNKELINDCEIFLGKTLKQRDDINNIIFAYSILNDEKGFEKFCFTGKYVNGMFRVIQNSANIAQIANTTELQKELSEHLEKIRQELERIIKSLPDKTQTRLKNKYLQISQQSLLDLKTLISDLDYLKQYLNHFKRNN